MATNVSFWQNMPAAAYVLLGVIISGVFAVFADYRNNKNNRELKELENKNSKELKELENKNNLEIQALEITHKEKLQKLKEDGDKALRLLDDKIKVFSDFHNDFAEILLPATYNERFDRINLFRKTNYKARLLVPLLCEKIDALDAELTAYSNFYQSLIQNTSTLSAAEIGEEVKKHNNKVSLTVNAILPDLTDQL